MKRVGLFFAFLALSLFEASAREIKLLTFNHSRQDTQVEYWAQTQGCTFKANELKIEARTKKSNILRELNILEDIYFGASLVKVSKHELIYRFDSIKNARVLNTLDSNCKLSRFLQIADKSIPFESVKVSYHYRLGFPTLDAVEFFEREGESVERIEDYDAKGYFPFYEFKLGMAMNIHTNIRPKDQRSFHRQNPIYEPRPTFMIRYGPAFLNNDGLGTLLLPFKSFTLLAAFILEGEPYEGEGLRKRRQSIYFGPLIRSYFVEIHYYKEILAYHRGEVLKISLAPEFEISEHFTLNPRLFYQYWDQRYVDYYFGLNESEGQRWKTAPFKGRETDNYGVALRGIYKHQRSEYFLNIGMKFYGQSVRNSPTTIRHYEYQLFGGFLYSFF